MPLYGDSKKAKVSTGDTTPSYLEDKILAGSNVTVAKEGSGADEKLRISASGATGDNGFLIFKIDGGLVYDTNGHVQVKVNE